ncbi:MAG: glycosyltransferase family 2 protein, partial [Armatimonadota bacterium]
MHPSVTAVVPTHNRCNLVYRVLEALESQTYQGQLDYVIVADGCTDDTVDVLRTLDLRRNSKIVECPGKGSAAARNLGASVARGEFLIFVDDDVIPSATLVAQHIEWHFKFPDSVVVGACPYGLVKRLSTLAQFARDWWHEVYREMSWPCCEDSYKCLLTGNLSIRRDLFLELGGFDETFRFPGREDYEFGVRLLKAGVKIRFNPEAYGYHYPADGFMARLPSFRSMGRGDVILVRKHPHLQMTTNLANLHQKDSVKSLFRFASLRFPRIASMLVFCISKWLAVTSSVIPLRLHGSILSVLVQFQYWLGVREEGFSLPEHDSLAENSWMLDAATRRIRIL